MTISEIFEKVWDHRVGYDPIKDAIRAAMENMRERACRAVCPECAKGSEPNVCGHLVYEGRPRVPCRAAAIRSLEVK